MLEWKKMRLINANALVEEIANIDDLRRLSTATIGMVLKAVPTIDAVPVVRCQDCKYRFDSIRCQMYSEGMKTPDSWYCADGERRECQ